MRVSASRYEHLGRVTPNPVRPGLPGVAACGAPYDGAGIPASIASAQIAAGQVLTYSCDLGGSYR